MSFFVLVMKIEFVSATDGFPEGNEPSASGGRYSEASEWQRSIFSRHRRVPPKIHGTATGRSSIPDIAMHRRWTLFVLPSFGALFPVSATISSVHNGFELWTLNFFTISSFFVMYGAGFEACSFVLLCGFGNYTRLLHLFVCLPCNHFHIRVFQYTQ